MMMPTGAKDTVLTCGKPLFSHNFMSGTVDRRENVRDLGQV